MKHSFLTIIVSVILGLTPQLVAANDNVLELPKLKNGQWWKVAPIFDQGTIYRSTCFERYDEYLVKILDRKLKVFVDKGEEEITCPEISNRLLGMGDGILGIHFPLEYNKPKTVETKRHPFMTIVITWVGEVKKYPLGQRVLDVHELTRRATADRNANVFDEKLLYSRECSCNVVFERQLQTYRNTITQKLFLKDFGFSNSDPARKDVAGNIGNDT